ncbi:2,3-bisphosphoglycerate-independent phosphoglycerate mutase [Pseudomonas putida]|uniref:2,3-bisphosphoglycerate-independent phosphoglycerate mutase n=1 Tax=Pseudomonas putida TaxID=303 RepID=UPI0033057538
MTTCTLIVLDGIGLRSQQEANAVAAANTPTLDYLFENYPHSEIATSGMAVGLPDGQMGNSEVGHMNLGAGRIVYQNFSRINKSIEDGSFYENDAFLEVVKRTRQRGGSVHLLGLLSPGGVHSHLDHFVAAASLVAANGIEQCYVHAFLDGRDTPPKSASESISALELELTNNGGGRIASLVGRYYAMDRDNRWSRVEAAYRLIVQGQSKFHYETAQEALQEAYDRGESDEFVQATSVGSPVVISENDAVILLNFRPDRSRQICKALTDSNFSEFKRPLVIGKEQMLTMTRYAEEFDVLCAFPPEPIRNSLGEYMAKLGRSQLRIAETEKYAHVTFFFNGGQEEPFSLEKRILVKSPLVESYDLQPEMSAFELTDNLVAEILSANHDLIVCNYANGDMVGHSGVFEAAVKAVEAVDQCLRRVVDAVLVSGGNCLITADHGNVEQMWDPEAGQVHTAHTLNAVPLICISGGKKFGLSDGRLCDIAPTILDILDLSQPKEMTGVSLLKPRHQ